MKTAGFSVVEALIATLLLVVLTGAVFQMVDPIHGVFQAEPETADQQQRLRVAVDALSASLWSAGAGSLVGPARGPLNRGVPAVVPYRVGESHPDAPAGIRFRPDVISLISVPRTAAQSTLRDEALPGASSIVLDIGTTCPGATALSVCGFGPGTRALIFDGTGRWDLVTVTAAHDATLDIAKPGGLAFAYQPGAIVSEVAVRVFALKSDASGVLQLSQYDGFQSELPLVDNMVSLGFEYFGDPAPPRRLSTVPADATRGPWTTYGPRPPATDVDDLRDAWAAGENCAFQVADSEHVPRLPQLGADASLVRLDPSSMTDGPWCPDGASVDAYDADLLRIRLVRVTLRTQVGSAALRGPVGVLFARGGRARTGARFVPDQQIVFDIAPPNLSAGR